MNSKLTKQLSKSIANYGRMGIRIEILEQGVDTVKVIVVQEKTPNGYFMNQKQLVERVKEVFKPTGLKTNVIPVLYSLDVSTITPLWIEDRMKEFGINRKDLLRQLAIDKSNLSLMLNSKRKMNKEIKSAFYYYFLVYQLNRDLRENIEIH